MKPVLRDAIVGLTAVAGIVGLAIMMLLFGEWVPTQEERYQITLKLPTAEGLTRGSEVNLSGVPIGEILTLEPAEFPERGAVLLLSIEADVSIPADCEVQISVGLLGDATLSLRTPRDFDPDAQPDEPEYIQPGETVAKDASTILEELTSVFEKRLVGLNEAAEALVQLSDTYTEVGGRMNELLEPRDPAEVDAGRVRPDDGSALARVSDAVASLDRWVGDDRLRTDFASTMSELPPLIERVAGAVDEWRGAAESVRTQVDNAGARFDDLTVRLASAADALNVALRDVRVITGRLIEGEGAAAQLLNNPDLYRSLEDSAVRLEEALREAQLFLQKIRAEGVPLNL